MQPEAGSLAFQLLLRTSAIAEEMVSPSPKRCSRMASMLLVPVLSRSLISVTVLTSSSPLAAGLWGRRFFHAAAACGGICRLPFRQAFFTRRCTRCCSFPLSPAKRLRSCTPADTVKESHDGQERLSEQLLLWRVSAG